ncbi:hypothetical protein FPHOBKDP_00118 [Listeria phage LPJP1]|nr:hypothetical protein FPHOBKDP_00118 [Listeria phage LPJP1]
MDLDIYPTRIVINNYSEKMASAVENSLSVWNAKWFKYDFKAYKIDDDKAIFPSGIDIDSLSSNLRRRQNVNIHINDKRNKNILRKNNFKMKYKPKNKIQEDAMNFLNDDNNYYQKFLSLKTGEGKTFCAINYINKIKAVPIIFIDMKSLLEQWKDRISEYTDVSLDNIYIISGIESIEKLEKMTKRDISKYKFFLSIHKTVNQLIQSDPDRVVKLFNRIGISIKVYDEAHVEYISVFNIDSTYDCPSLYLTATPSRSNPIENKVYQNMYMNVPKFSTVVSDSDRYIRTIICKIDTKPSNEDLVEIRKKSKGYGFNVPSYSQYIIDKKHDEYYNYIYQIIFDIIFDKGKNKRKTAILFKNKIMVNAFYQDFLVEIENNKWDISVSRFYSDVPKDEKSTAFEKDIIVTTDKSFGKGLDEQSLRVLVNTVPSGSEEGLIQIMGRLRKVKNKECLYFDVIDTGFDECKRQLTKRKKIYRKRCKEIIESKLEII